MGARSSEEAKTHLSSHPTSAAAARRFVGEVLSKWSGPVDPEDPALVCTDELVTNAIVHVASDIDVVVRWCEGTLRVEVHDRSTTPPLRRLAGLTDDAGRGLQLVEALSERWGVVSENGGKAVWFELPRTLGGLQ